jgi:hypothetical protein
MNWVLLGTVAVGFVAIMAGVVPTTRWGPQAVSPTAAISLYGQMLDSLAEGVNAQRTLLGMLTHGPPGSNAEITRVGARPGARERARAPRAQTVACRLGP